VGASSASDEAVVSVKTVEFANPADSCTLDETSKESAAKCVEDGRNARVWQRMTGTSVPQMVIDESSAVLTWGW
jgi:hypothetical protein